MRGDEFPAFADYSPRLYNVGEDYDAADVMMITAAAVSSFMNHDFISTTS